MSAADEETKVQELVIIRRPISSEEAGHKGGVWKIAYADFMTAMMAFFLVMWLINASDKQTLTQVATYFNPLRLTDKVALSKGMHQSDSVSQSSEKKPASSKQQPGAGKSESKASGAKPKYTEEVLFRDPYGTLSKLASQAAEDQSQPTKGGEAYRDPFDPVFRRETQAEKRENAKQTAAPVVAESAAPNAAPATAQAKQITEAKQSAEAEQNVDAKQNADPSRVQSRRRRPGQPRRRRHRRLRSRRRRVRRQLGWSATSRRSSPGRSPARCQISPSPSPTRAS